MGHKIFLKKANLNLIAYIALKTSYCGGTMSIDLRFCFGNHFKFGKKYFWNELFQSFVQHSLRVKSESSIKKLGGVQFWTSHPMALSFRRFLFSKKIFWVVDEKVFFCHYWMECRLRLRIMFRQLRKLSQKYLLKIRNFFDF